MSSHFKKVEGLFDEIESLFTREKFLPGLILYYSAIDILAFLSKPNEQNEVKKNDYLGWCDKYLVPQLDQKLGLTAEDLLINL